MSKDKYQSKRAYSIRGANTKAKRKKAKAGGGKKSRPGSSLVSACPECGDKVAVASNTKEVSCKAGHSWKVV